MAISKNISQVQVKIDSETKEKVRVIRPYKEKELQDSVNDLGNNKNYTNTKELINDLLN